jgi:hypothetical protein
MVCATLHRSRVARVAGFPVPVPGVAPETSAVATIIKGT